MNHRQAHRSGRARLRFETLEPRHMLSATGDTFIAHENLFFPSSVEQQEMERVVGTDLTSLFVDYGKYQADTTLAASLAEYRAGYGRTLAAAYDHETARVALDIVAFESADAIMDDLANIGFEYVASIGRVASGWLPLDALDELISIEGVNFATSPSPVQANVGISESQGDATQQTETLRNRFGYTGAGITVGVISTSYDLNGNAITRREDDVASGDLPGATNPFGYTSQVNVLYDDVPSRYRNDEGRAMLQIIHDVAPGANLAFSSVGNFEALFQTQFANRIRGLAKVVSEGGAGADVIVDDITIRNAPMFEDGFVAQAVDEVVGNGVVYVSSAGNVARRSYESDFVPGNPIQIFGRTEIPHIIDPGTGSYRQRLTLPQGSFYDLQFQWDEPFFSLGGSGAATDLNVYLVPVKCFTHSETLRPVFK